MAGSGISTVQPVAATPGVGDGAEIAPGVVWLPVSDRANSYAIKGEAGWAVVDPGPVKDADGLDWPAVIASALNGGPVAQVIGSTAHPDRIGSASALCAATGAAFAMDRTAYLAGRAGAADTEAVTSFSAQNGAEAETRPVLPDLPPAHRRISVEREFLLAGSPWRVLKVFGHAAAQTCLWDAGRNVLLTGDLACPSWTPPIAATPDEPDGDAMGEWIASCWHVMAQAPEAVIVAPACGPPYVGLHVRLEAQIRAAEDQINAAAAALQNGGTAADVAKALKHEVGEARALVNYLALRGRAERKGAAPVTFTAVAGAGADFADA